MHVHRSRLHTNFNNKNHVLLNSIMINIFIGNYFGCHFSSIDKDGTVLIVRSQTAWKTIENFPKILLPMQCCNFLLNNFNNGIYIIRNIIPYRDRTKTLELFYLLSSPDTSSYRTIYIFVLVDAMNNECIIYVTYLIHELLYSLNSNFPPGVAEKF